MSKEVDERVVSMQFNNKNFEANAQTTLGTLDKLKQKLNFSGASKGLENVGAAAKKVDMSGISSGIETVRTRFSALEVMGVTALANITNSAVNAGKRIVSALTIDPVKTGLSEYELKLNSVQTIMASTGEDIKTVNKYLEDLNTYSDQTIYSFSDMTQNIGKFTNAGVKLEDAVTAIKGISNAAALSGANTQEASRSMYNFAQALSAGYVKLIDWKSIELANMATKGFKEELIKTAVEVGTLTKKGDQYVSTTTDMNGKVSEAFTSTKFFNESLSAQWMTTDVLIKTLARYTDETTQLGKDATQAATQVKTLSQMFDVLKETAQSGWAKTWEIIFGDLEQAKAIFTPLTSFFGKIIDKMSEFRNKILEGALGNPFELLLKKLDASPLGKITKTVTDATGKLEYYQDIVSKVWNGDYKNAPVRYQLLDDAGYDHRIVQSLVNKGYEYKLTVKDIEDAYKKYGKTVETVTEPTKDLAKTLEELSDEELKNLGYTDEEIRMLRALAQEAKKTGKPISELIAEMSKADGRTLLVESFKNIGKTIGDLGKTIKKAWQEIFPPKTAEERSIQLYNLIKALNSFTKKLQMSTDTADKFRRTFKGVFALLDIILTVIGGPIKLVFKILKQLLGVANIDLLSLTAIIGDGIVKFRDWIDRVLDFTDVFKKLLPTLKKAGKAFGDWIDKLKQSDNIPRDIILGLVNGLKAGITTVGKTVWELGKSIIEKLCDVLGIHSPSVKGEWIGKNFILGVLKGLKEAIKIIWDFTISAGKKLIEIVKDISLDKILLGFIAGGIVIAFVKIADALRGLTAPLKGFGDMMEGLGDMFEGLGASLKANAWKKKADAIKSIAVAIAILAGSVIVLSFIKPGKLWASIAALAVLAAVVVALAFAASKMGDLKDMGKATISIVGIAASLLLAAMALKKLAGIETDQMKMAVFGLIAVTSAMVGLIAIFGLFAKNKSMYKAGKMLQQMVVAMLIMTVVIKIMGSMDPEDVGRGLGVLILVGAVIGAMVIVSSFAGEHADKAGKMLLKMSVALLILGVAIKIMGVMNPEDVGRGLGVLILVGAVFAAMVIVSKLAGEHADKVGKMLLKMSAAFLILSITMKILSSIDDNGIARGLAFITMVSAVFAGFMVLSRFSGSQANKIGKMLIAISGALLIMTGVIWLLSLFEPKDLVQGLAALTLMEACIAGLIAVTYLAKDSKDMQTVLIILTVAIALLAGAVLGLSFLDPSDIARSTAAIVLVIGAFAALIGITKLANGTKDIQKTLITLTIVVAALAGIIVGLSFLKPESVVASSKAISVLLISLSASMLILSKVKTISTSAKSALLPMIGVVAGLGAILVGIGKLMDAVPELEGFLDKGIPILEKIGYALGSFFGNIVGGFLGGITNGLPDMANDLSLFMTNLKPFIDGAKTIDASVVSGVVSIAKVVLALTAANILEGLTSWFTGGSSIADFGAEIAEFGPHLKAFGDSVKGIDGTSIQAAANAAKALAQMADTIPNEGGVIGWFAGESSISKFADELQPLGEGLREFSEEVAGVNPEAITAAANAAKTLAEMTDAIPNEGGVAGWFAGENSISKFADELQPLGEGLKAFSDETSGINPETVKAAAGAAQSIAEMADKIPNSGGVAGWFAGENSLAQFAGDLGPLGEGLKAFSDETSGINPETVEAGVAAAGSIADMTKKLPETSVFGKLFTGEQSLADFSSDLKKFGKGIKGYSDELKGVNPSILKGATEAAGTVIDVLTRETQNTQAGIYTAIAALPEFGKAVKAFYLYAQGINIDTITSVTKAITRVNSVANNFSSAKTILMSKAVTNMGNSLKGLASISPNSTKGFVQSIKNLSEVNIDTFVSALKDGASALEKVGINAVDAFVKGASSRQSSACTRMKNIGVNLINTFNIGVQSQKGRAGTASLVVLKACLAAIQSKYASFKVAGGNAAKGFANGISANTFLAAAKARAMAKAAKEAAEEELDENSPSKVFYGIGDFAGVAFVNALGDYVDTASDAGGELAKASIDGLRSSMSNMFDVINGNLDVQPTIAPVLDLSEVQSGARHINDLFSGNRTLSVNGRTVGNVSMRISEIQNGRNNDLLTAIKSLSKDVANMPRNNYTINGLSYEEGSDVAEALQTIIRVAKIERRV